MTFRQTLASEISASGVTLHVGRTVNMRLSPAADGAGIVFRRADLGVDIPARYDLVTETRLGTVIAGEGGANVGVIEHLMAAVAGAGVDDMLVTLDGPEPPILDGDALSYLVLLQKAGLKPQQSTRHAIKVLRPVEVQSGEARVTLSPAEALSYEFEIAFPNTIVGRQTFSLTFSGESFARDIAPARTFGFTKEFDALNKMGLARGASLENTLAVDGARVLNAGLMRFTDEFVRHKILDAIGDMALAGAPLVARFQGFKSGHATNNAVLRVLFADHENYAMIEAA
jgi:UDP-3-O-[3-hydroxymyristoyl] N-acetylglucosamine deacetylase